MTKKNKNQMLHEIKEMVKSMPNKTFYFPNITIPIWKWEKNQIPTTLISLSVKKDTLYLELQDYEEHSVERLFEFDVDEVESILDIVSKNANAYNVIV